MLATVLTKTTRDSWKAVAIAGVSLTALLAIAMAAYRSVDVSFYSEMPEIFRSLMSIPEGTDVAGLAVGVFYGVYGALTVAGLAISMGGSSIAGEEHNGTIGLLLGNPKSRSHVLAHKLGNMVLLIAASSLALWVAAYAVAGLLGVELGGLRVGWFSLHLFVSSVFYGVLAAAVGAWTGSRGMASGVSAGLLGVGFIAGGLFPLIEGWENVAKVFPWYYFDGADPIQNGASWGHISVLLGSSLALGASAFVGVNRRDLKSQSVGVTLLDRLRANPTTQKIVDRIAGSTRVSRIWIKTASEHQGLLIIIVCLMFLLMGVLMGPLYVLMDEALLSFSEQVPEAMYAFAGSGGGDMATAEGFYEVETFGLVAPLVITVVAVVISSKALAGEEANRTMGLLLANPIKRSKVLLEKTFAMVVYALTVGIATWLGVWLGSVLAGLGMNWMNIAATSLLATLVGLVFGALSLLLGAATGRTKIAAFTTAGIAFAAYLINSIAILNDTVEAVATVSPFRYYLRSTPLVNGMHWGHGAILTATVVVLVIAAVVLFDRRDIRQGG